jgi:hypothetical protein
LKLHLPLANLDIYQKAVQDLSIEIFNSLPSRIKNSFDNPKPFQNVLKRFLYTIFYSLDEYYNKNNNSASNLLDL